MRTKIIRCFVSCLLFAGTVPVLDAGKLTVSAEAVSAGGGPDQNPVGCTSFPGTVLLSFTETTVSCSGTTLVKAGPFTGSTYDSGGIVYAAASPDTLKVHASVNGTNVPHDSFWHPGGAGSYGEAMTANGFSVANMSGMTMVQFALEFNGITTTAPGTDTFAGGSLAYGPEFAPLQAFILHAGDTTIVTQKVPMDLASNFLYTLDLVAGAFLCNSCTSKTPDLQYSGFAEVDFSHTVKLVGMSLTDMNGNPLTGLTINSLDGIDYSALLNAGTNVSSVPEPSTGAAVLALLAIVFKSRRRRRKNSPSRTDDGRPVAP